MRSILITVLLSGVVLLIASSCATVPKEPLASGEVRLSSIDVLGSGIEANSFFAVNIFSGRPVSQRLRELVSMNQGRSHPVLMHRMHRM